MGAEQRIKKKKAKLTKQLDPKYIIEQIVCQLPNGKYRIIWAGFSWDDCTDEPGHEIPKQMVDEFKQGARTGNVQSFQVQSQTYAVVIIPVNNDELY